MEEPISGWPPVKIQTYLRAVSMSTKAPVIHPALLAEDAVAYDSDISQNLDKVPEIDSFWPPSPDSEDEALLFPGSDDEEDLWIPDSFKEGKLTGVSNPDQCTNLHTHSASSSESSAILTTFLTIP